MKRGLLPGYARTNSSHCWYTNNIHFHAWSGRGFTHRRVDGTGNRTKTTGTKRGLSLKRRLRQNRWRHYSVSVMRYDSREKGCGEVRHFEICWHDSTSPNSDRVKGSKRYLRFKVCL